MKKKYPVRGSLEYIKWVNKPLYDQIIYEMKTSPFIDKKHYMDFLKSIRDEMREG
jgi:hypothetical protein